MLGYLAVCGSTSRPRRGRDEGCAGAPVAQFNGVAGNGGAPVRMLRAPARPAHRQING